MGRKFRAKVAALLCSACLLATPAACFQEACDEFAAAKNLTTADLLEIIAGRDDG